MLHTFKHKTSSSSSLDTWYELDKFIESDISKKF